MTTSELDCSQRKVGGLIIKNSFWTTFHIQQFELLRPCLHEENLPLVGGLYWPPSQLLACVYMGKSKVAPLCFDLRELVRVTFLLPNFFCTAVLYWD